MPMLTPCAQLSTQMSVATTNAGKTGPDADALLDVRLAPGPPSALLRLDAYHIELHVRRLTNLDQRNVRPRVPRTRNFQPWPMEEHAVLYHLMTCAVRITYPC